jgi:hypothetical protein
MGNGVPVWEAVFPPWAAGCLALGRGVPPTAVAYYMAEMERSTTSL